MRVHPAVLPDSRATSTRILAALLLAVSCSLAACTAAAAAARRRDASTRKTGNRWSRRRNWAVDVLPQAPEPKPALGAPGLKLVVSGFRITGNTIYPENVLLEQVTEFVGKEQTIDGLNDAATKVRAYYRERGYFLVQAYLPQQEIKGGVVEIAVIEARIGKVAVNIKEGTRYSEYLVRGIVETHLRGGRDHHRDRPRDAAAAAERPAERERHLRNQAEPDDRRGRPRGQRLGSPGAFISGSVDVDNYGNRYTGQYRHGVTFNLNNPFALGDQISYRAFNDRQRHGLLPACLRGAGRLLGHARRRELHDLPLPARQENSSRTQSHGVGRGRPASSRSIRSSARAAPT